nr:hypothetical protein [Gordonia humi]
MPAAPLLVCFALLLGIVLLAAVWPRTEDIAVEAAQIKRDIDAKSTASANAFDTGATGAGAHRAPPRTPPTASTGPSPETRRQQWVRATEHHDAVLGAYGSYELDPAMLLRYPAMWDLSAQPVMDFHDALDLAGSLRTEQFTDGPIASDYVDAVSILRSEWHKVDRFARSTGTDHLTDDDARDCRRALKLLDHANGTAGAERATYLQQVMTTVGRLTDRGVVADVPRIRLALEAQVRLALEA